MHFVLEKMEFMPHGDRGWAFKEKPVVQMPNPGKTPKLHFPVNKLQKPYYGKSVIWPNSRVTLRKSLLAASYKYCKKDHIDLINLNDIP